MRRLLLLLLLVFGGMMTHAQTKTYRAYTDSLVARLQRDDFAAATRLLSPGLAQKLTAEQLAAVWEGLQLAHGPFQKSGNDSLVLRNNIPYYYRQWHFDKQNIRLEFAFAPDKRISALQVLASGARASYLPPPYDQPERYREFSLPIRYDTIVLPAILTLPVHCQRCPVVVLLPDLGPQDKDHSIGPTKMFRDLAVGLAAEGIATFRFDKRTFRYGPELMADLRLLTLETEMLEDVQVALKQLAQVAEIDTNRLHLLGLGLGGMAAGRVARFSPWPVRSITVVGSSPRPLPDQLFDQFLPLLAEKSGTADWQPAAKVFAAQVALAKSSKLNHDTPADSLPLQLPGPYWKYLQQNDLVNDFWFGTAPLWLVRGARDYQSQPDDLTAWEGRLAGRGNLRTEELPGLNHLLMHVAADTPLLEHYQLPGHVDVAFVRQLAAFVLQTK
ncbi:MAG: hypothetical protein C0424_12730 [Sphingobacteriaceae bacterium]|nr:hypothetical protein [Sphingobacteriaceae bacterium]